MAENNRLKEITDSIEKGIQELFTSEKYQQYLRTMSRFHNYSLNNTMLIYLQKPEATLVAGFHKWKNQFGRTVNAGEHGIKIIAPTPIKRKVEKEKLDPDTKQPMLDADGKVIMEEKEVRIPMYKPVTVFDVSQTSGKPLPQLASSLSGDVQDYEIFMEALRRSAPVPIAFQSLGSNTDGYFSPKDQAITLREGMSQVQTVSAAVHEIAHSKIHNPKLYEDVVPQWKVVMVSEGETKRDYLSGFDTQEEAEAIAVESEWVYRDENDFEWQLTVEEDTSATQYIARSRRTEEVEAESISYAVCAYYGIATGENSFGYIASWSKGQELSELKASLETINRTASELITDIDRNYAEIRKERGLDAEIVEPSQEQDTVPEQVIEPEKEPAPSEPVQEGYRMPDPAVSMETMKAYGYTKEDMLPLAKARAMELNARGIIVYALHEDNVEAMVAEPEDITMHSGLFGIQREDWEAIRDDMPEPLPQAFSIEAQRAADADFASLRGDAFAIYQLRDGEATRDLRFSAMDYLTQKGLTVDRSNYEQVYVGALPKYGSTAEKLEQIFDMFNFNRPSDFKDRSLSVSDVIAIKEGDQLTCHYCDSIGFPQVPGFLPQENYLKAAEQSLEDDYGMIDGIINNGPKPTVEALAQKAQAGQPVSVVDLVAAAKEEKKTEEAVKPKPKTRQRKSVLAQLRAYQEEDRKQKTAPSKSAERNI